MPTDATDSPQSPEIHVDEDWKERVKAEDAALDRKLRGEDSEQQPGTADKPTSERAGNDGAGRPDQEAAAAASDAGRKADVPLPPPDFAMLVGMFSTQAMVALGLLADPATGEAEVQPALARHFIDLLGVLEDKTAGNLTPQEKALLDSSLHQLRIVYVEQTTRK